MHFSDYFASFVLHNSSKGIPL